MTDEFRLEHSSDLNQATLRELVECNLCKSIQELTGSQHILINNLMPQEKIGKVSKLCIGVPHTRSEKDKEDCISIMTSLFSRLRNDPFLKNIITGEKKKRSFMTMFTAKGTGLTGINLHSLPQRWSFMEEKLFCVYGEIITVLFILSF